jgi:WD40 repeat protein
MQGMGEIVLWDAASGSKLRNIGTSPMSNLTSMGNPGRPGSMPSLPNMADISTMMTNVLGSMSAGTMGRSVTSVAFSPDGKVLAAGGVESKSNLDLAAMMSGAMNPKAQKNRKPSDNPMDFLKDIKVETIGQVVLWDSANGTEVGRITGHGKAVTGVAFSRDGKLLASSSTDNTIKLWDAATKRELRTLTGHTGNIESMAFSPDSRLLASAGEDGSTFLWDAGTGEHLLTLSHLMTAVNGWSSLRKVCSTARRRPGIRFSGVITRTFSTLRQSNCTSTSFIIPVCLQISSQANALAWPRTFPGKIAASLS